MDLTRQLRGKQVAHVASNGSVLSIRMADGAEINVRWVDGNGETCKGLPVVSTRGYRLKAEGIRDLIQLPISRRA